MTNTIQFLLEDINTNTFANLSGPLNENFKLIENRLNVKIANREEIFEITGETAKIEATKELIKLLYKEAKHSQITTEKVHLFLQSSYIEEIKEQQETLIIRTRKAVVKAKGRNQNAYLKAIEKFDINFGIGPAGTGKTFLAVAKAAELLEKDKIRRILLVRPAVEAGEKLGFLPGDLTQKIDPYLRPLYDALYEMLGFETVGKLIEKQIIEVAPLAYMRGRTLNNSFIILDESQNTTQEQMKMFLTRIGFGSTAVITGDITQVDLPKGVKSGLRSAIEVLEGVEGISFTQFSSKDVVRHPLVARIVDAYDKYNKEHNKF